MSRIEARIECVVNRPFIYYGIKYECGDIFPLNPNNPQQKGWVRTGRIYEMPEPAYEYICVYEFGKELFNKFYQYNEVVDIENIGKKFIDIQVKRGYLKKSIKKDSKDVDMTYNDYAKSKGLLYKELKVFYKEKFDEYLPHHNVKIDAIIFDKLEKIVPRVNPEV